MFVNLQRLPHLKVQVDGCILKNQLAADYVVSQGVIGDVIVELKGKDVEHAVKQVEATASHWQEQGYRVGRLAALIVSTQFPKANTQVRKAQENFAKKYKGPLHVVTKNYEGCLERVLSFNGPHKI